MPVVKPTIMVAVPRLFEVLYSRIMQGAKRTTGLKRWLFDRTLDIGTRRATDPASLTVLDKLLDPVLSKLVRAKVRERFGGRLIALVSGGAPLNVEIGIAFQALGLPIYQGYGQTEAAPIVSVNRPRLVKMHAVGPVLEGVTVQIAEDGEILVKGDLVMQGYWGDQSATDQTLRDGWLHTGDIGVVDSDGYIQITDRKKDIIVISGGDNIAPARVEGLLTLEPEIAQAMVHGDKRPYLVAVLVADDDVIRKAAGEPDPAAAVKKTLSAAVDRVNKRLSQIERVRSFVVAEEAFSIDNQQMTPTLKVRRHVVRARYGAELEALYPNKS
jgi:long-chain acyl-CoA synthetase